MGLAAWCYFTLSAHKSPHSPDCSGNLLCRGASKSKDKAMKWPPAFVIVRQWPKQKVLL